MAAAGASCSETRRYPQGLRGSQVGTRLVRADAHTGGRGAMGPGTPYLDRRGVHGSPREGALDTARERRQPLDPPEDSSKMKG